MARWHARLAVVVALVSCEEGNRETAADIDLLNQLPLSASEATADAVVEAAAAHDAALIITLTLTGTSARLISKYRPRCPIMVIASDAHVGAALNLHFGCVPFHYPHERVPHDEEARRAPPHTRRSTRRDAHARTLQVRFAFAIRKAKEVGLIRSGESAVLAHGHHAGASSLSAFRLVVIA